MLCSQSFLFNSSFENGTQYAKKIGFFGRANVWCILFRKDYGDGINLSASFHFQDISITIDGNPEARLGDKFPFKYLIIGPGLCILL